MKLLRPIFILHAVFWLSLGFIFIFQQANLFLAILIFINSLVLFWIGWNIKKQKRFIYIISLCYILLNLILTITDDFGILDLLALIINIITLILLIANRRYWLKSKYFYNGF